MDEGVFTAGRELGEVLGTETEESAVGIGTGGGGEAEELLDDAGQGGGIAAFDFEDFDLGFGARGLIEFFDEGFDQGHALAGCADDDSVDARISGHDDTGEDAGIDHPFGAFDLEFSARGCGITGGDESPGAGLPPCSTLTAGIATGAGLTGDGGRQDADDIIGEGVGEREDAYFVLSWRAFDVEFLNEFGDFLEVAWAGLNDERVGTVVGDDADAGSQAGAAGTSVIIAGLVDEEVSDGGFRIASGSMDHAEDAELAIGVEGLVEFDEQFSEGIDGFFLADEEERVGLIQRGDADLSLALSEDLVVEVGDDRFEGLAIDMFEWIDFDHGFGFLALLFDFLDDFEDALDVFLVPFEDDEAEFGNEFDLDIAEQA